MAADKNEKATEDISSVYRLSVIEAVERGELKAYLTNLHQNQACAEAIATAIKDSYQGNFRYDMDFAVIA